MKKKIISQPQKKVRFSENISEQIIENIVEKNKIEFQKKVTEEQIKGQLHLAKSVSYKKLDCLGLN
tara:strand:- start:1354 stop:1551 length:198 start_codon:yes stop_codon:yes gene_type:complete